jgi:hypothetical protein
VRFLGLFHAPCLSLLVRPLSCPRLNWLNGSASAGKTKKCIIITSASSSIMSSSNTDIATALARRGVANILKTEAIHRFHPHFFEVFLSF